MQNKIEKLEITKLFGRFNYILDFSEKKSGISILTAPNGFGKSTILKIIERFVSGDYFYFINESFDSIKFTLASGDKITITRQDDDQKNGHVSIINGRKTVKVRNPFDDQTKGDQLFLIDRTLPFLTRVSQKTWRHDRTGEIFNSLQILQRYGDHPNFRRQFRQTDWLEEIRKSLSVFSIPTHRLKADEPSSETRFDAGNSSSLMVDAIAKEIKEKIQLAIRNQFEIGRKKETSFPTRLIESLSSNIAPSRESVRESINAVQEYEERFSRLGLVPNTGTTKQFGDHAESTETAGMLVLKTYLDDIREKFSELDDLARQLDVFCNSINALLAFKAIETSADEGIIVRVIDGERQRLSLPVLSSGEQHLIVLIGKLIFDTNQGSLVLIDEPEISFHPEWQEKFIGILEDIRGVNGFSALVATHSPILIGDRWEDVIELAEQHEFNIK